MSIPVAYSICTGFVKTTLTTYHRDLVELAEHPIVQARGPGQLPAPEVGLEMAFYAGIPEIKTKADPQPCSCFPPQTATSLKASNIIRKSERAIGRFSAWQPSDLHLRSTKQFRQPRIMTKNRQPQGLAHALAGIICLLTCGHCLQEARARSLFAGWLIVFVASRMVIRGLHALSGQIAQFRLQTLYLEASRRWLLRRKQLLLRVCFGLNFQDIPLRRKPVLTTSGAGKLASASGHANGMPAQVFPPISVVGWLGSFLTKRADLYGPQVWTIVLHQLH